MFSLSPLPAPVPQSLDSAELDFSRYGDVLFEVAFAGARLTTGGNVATDGKKLDFNVRRSSSSSSRAAAAASVLFARVFWLQTAPRQQ